jgi:type IV secretion system protein VirB8
VPMFRSSSPSPDPQAGKAIERFLDWEYDTNEAARRQARIAWALAALCLVLALAAVGAVAALAPLKTVEPIFVRVDSATGAVDVLHRIDEEMGLGRQDLLDKGYLARYVRSREGYFFPTIQEQYRRVLLMSVGDARASFEHDFARDNPQAPVNRYRDKQSVEIALKSISFIGKGLAQVRYVALTNGGEEARRQHWIATIRYEYEPDATIPLSVLEDNALGFAVTEYRAEPEDAS